MSNEFLDDLFGDHEGIVYSPVKDPKWVQHFFEWPTERAALEAHIEDYHGRDVYISPVLFTERRVSPDTFKGTNYLWTEFDGRVPAERIAPSIRVLSSTEGHEHWYWRLNSFITDRRMIEDYTKRIAYHYGADLSVWDYQNVLRPPDTWNHKRNRPVSLLDRNELKYSLTEFMGVPLAPETRTVDIQIGDLPRLAEILAKYRWKPDTTDLILKAEVTDRSDALFRLAFDAVEAGCSNEEVYVLIEDRDKAWGKYVERTDRQKQLENIISRVRGRKALTQEITHGTPEVYRFEDFMKTNIKIKWVIEGVLPVAGSMVIFGKPGVGKTTLALRAAISMAIGHEKFLIWDIVNVQRTLFLSLEMQHYEVKSFFEDMKIPKEHWAALQEKFFIWPIGSAYPLDTPDQQRELLRYIDLHKIELIVIDSLSLSMYGSVKDDDDVKRLNSFLNEDLRRDRKCGYIFIHHPRKRAGLEDRDKEQDGDDVFGSTYISANAQTVIVLSQKTGSTRLRIKFIKTRMMQGAKEIEIERTPDRGFQLVGANTTQETTSPNVQGGEAASNEKGNALSLGRLFEL